MQSIRTDYNTAGHKQIGRNSLNVLTGVPNMFNIAHGTTIVMHEVNRLLFPFAAICSE